MSEGFKLYWWTFFFFFINTPRSAAAQWMAIKCIPEVRSCIGKASLIDIMCGKISKIVNNSAGDCSISLKFRRDFDHVTSDVPRTFKVNGSTVKVTAWHNVSASKTHLIQAQINCWRSNLVQIILEPSATRNTCSPSRSLGQILKSQ